MRGRERAGLSGTGAYFNPGALVFATRGQCRRDSACVEGRWHDERTFERYSVAGDERRRAEENRVSRWSCAHNHDVSQRDIARVTDGTAVGEVDRIGQNGIDLSVPF